MGETVHCSRLEEEEERFRLKDLVHRLRDEEQGHGYIVRTNAEGVNDFALSADMAYLLKVWQAVRERSEKAAPATRVYEDLSLPLRALRDTAVIGLMLCTGIREAELCALDMPDRRASSRLDHPLCSSCSFKNAVNLFILAIIILPR